MAAVARVSSDSSKTMNVYHLCAQCMRDVVM